MAAAVREAMLYDRLPNSRVKCHVCLWRCLLNPGQLGVCRMRQNTGGEMVLLNYALVSSAALDPIEKKPLFHFFPGTEVFSLGTWGCNFQCVHCQNWEISCVEATQDITGSRKVTPGEAVELTLSRGGSGIAWTYNEPSIWFEYTFDSARLAKERNLYTVYVTNGYLTPEGLDIIGPYLDAWRVDIKGFSDEFYLKLAKVSWWRGILEVARMAKEKWKMHVEVVTNIIPTMNDDPEQLHALALWIRDNLGELTPWHVTRFYPHHNLNHLPPTPLDTLEKAHEIGRRAGLRFIYLGNVPGHDSESTLCYQCGKLVVGRFGYATSVVGLDGGRCRFCGADLNFVVDVGQRKREIPLFPPLKKGD